MTPIRNAILFSDTHCGCQRGLCPPEIKLRHGGTYTASKFQVAIWECWQHFWDKWVPKVVRGEQYVVIFNGDAMDGRHHRSTTQISQDLSDQAKIAEEVLKPIVDKSSGFYFVSGTSAHAGESAEQEEELAKALGAERDEETGNHTRFELFINIGNAHVHVSHHIGITGSAAYETTALTKEYQEFCADSAKWMRQRPDVVVRSHRHRHSEVRVPTASGYGTIFVTAAWQLKTPFLFQIPGGRTTNPMIGGSLIRQGDEEFFTRHITWETGRSKTVVPEVRPMVRNA